MADDYAAQWPVENAPVLDWDYPYDVNHGRCVEHGDTERQAALLVLRGRCHFDHTVKKL